MAWAEALVRRGELLWASKRKRPGRLKAYTLGGKWVCLPGLGEGEDFGTFPRDWQVRQLTNTPGWVEILKSPKAGERVQEGVHWQRLDTSSWRPATVVFCNPVTTSTIGVASDYLDYYDATHLQVLSTVAQIPVEDVADPDDGPSNPSTPPTPRLSRESTG